MNEFSDIQQIWNQQLAPTNTKNSSEIIGKANLQIKQYQRKYIGTIAILSTTVIGLILYLQNYLYKAPTFFLIGLLLMICSLFIRIFSELFSLMEFKAINILSSNIVFTKQLLAYYQFRKKVLFILTPIVILLYIIGFILLLPTFYKIFSTGFFVYIIISGFGFLSFITWLIFKQAKQEIQFLNSLKQIHTHHN